MTNYDLQSEIEKAIQLLEEDIADAVAEERAAVVAWLREWSQPPSGLYDLSVRTSVLLEASDIIERGEHRREKER